MSKKKINLFVILTLTFLFSMPTFAIRSIHFGKYWDRESRSIFSDPIPFEAFIDDSIGYIQINFNENTEGMIIEITDQNGNTIYNTGLNSQQNESLQIPIDGFKAGNYTIIITDPSHKAIASFLL